MKQLYYRIKLTIYLNFAVNIMPGLNAGN